MPLTDATIRNLKPRDKPYKVSEFEGLFLLVKPTGLRLWHQKYRIDGKEKLLAIGSYPEVSLAQARQARDAARALVDWLATDPTSSGDPDFLIVGDLNSYAKEDPIDAIVAGADDAPGSADDYTNLIAQFQGALAYSYLFDSQVGYLDHALASAGLLPQVEGASELHINADEPDLLDYDTSFKKPAQVLLYEPNAYRASDHDPVLVGIDLGADDPDPTPTPDPNDPRPFKLRLPMLRR